VATHESAAEIFEGFVSSAKVPLNDV